MAQPKNEKVSLIDKELFEKYCKSQNSQVEIASFFGVSVNTLKKFCRQTYNSDYLTVYQKLTALGRANARKALYVRGIEGKDRTCLIFYLKNHCGFRDNPLEVNDQADAFISAVDSVLKMCKRDVEKGKSAKFKKEILESENTNV